MATLPDEFIVDPARSEADADAWDAAHGLRPLAEADSTGWQGVTRFYDVDGDDVPQRVLTCWWGRAGVTVEAVWGWPGWSPELAGLLPRPVRWSAWVPLALVPRRVRGWGEVSRVSATAPPCGPGWDDRIVFGGATCGHRVIAPGGPGTVWWTPQERHEAQWRVIRAYRRLRKLAWACSWLTGCRPGRRTRRCT